MAKRLSLFLYMLSLLSPLLVQAQTTAQTITASTASLNLIPEYVYPPLTVTGQFPCLTANSYMIFTDSQSSSATYPVWTCTSECGSLSSGVGLMVFPATITTGTYEVQNPPSGYPALEISNLAVITDSTFSTYTSINVQGPLPTTTSTFTYPAFPGLSLAIKTTTSITAVLATPISVPIDCKGSAGASQSAPASTTASSISQASSASLPSSFLASTIGVTSGGNTERQSSLSASSQPTSLVTDNSASVPGSASSKVWSTSVTPTSNTVSSPPSSDQSGGRPSISSSASISMTVSAPSSQLGAGGSTNSGPSFGPFSTLSSQSNGFVLSFDSFSTSTSSFTSSIQTSTSGSYDILSLASTSASHGQAGASTSASSGQTGVTTSVSVSGTNSASSFAPSFVSSGQAGNPTSTSNTGSLPASSAKFGVSNTASTSGGSVSSFASTHQAGTSESFAPSSVASNGASNTNSASNSESSNQPLSSSRSLASLYASSGRPSSSSSGSWYSPASVSASVSAPTSSSTQVLPPGATVIISTLSPSGSVTTSRTISETFIPTTYSTLTGLTSTLTTSSIISFGTSSTTIIPITIYPGGSAWGIPSVGAGTPIFSAPSVAPSVAPSSTQVLPPGATVITSTLNPSGSITTSRTISETFIPTTYSVLTGLTSTLTTSSIISFGTSSTTAIPITIYPGGSAWGIPSVGPGTPIFPAPSVAPNVGQTWSSAPSMLGSSSTLSSLSGFTTSFVPGGWGDLPASLTAEPPPLDNSPAPSLLALLTTFTGTTSPTIEEISTGVSSDTHSPTDHAVGFPIFWGHSHFCFLFCPSHGHCLFCGFKIDLRPGIYPPGSIQFPPGWTEPDITITIEPDGTPTYDEDEEPTTTSTTTTTTSSTTSPTTTSTSASQPSNSASKTASQIVSSSVSQASSVSSGSSSGNYLCAPTCSSCANNDLPSSTPPPNVKRDGKGGNAPKNKRMLDWPDNFPYDGDVDLFTWWQWKWNLIGLVGHRQDYTHPSSSFFYPLTNFPFSTGVAGLYGCTSLIVHSSRGVWISHLWENPSFDDPTIDAAQQQSRFQQQVLNILGPGDGTTGFPGLSQYMGAGDAFSPDMYVQAIIITPRDRWNPVPGVLMYANMAQQIARTVTSLFGGNWDAGNNGNLAAPVLVGDYTPLYTDLAQNWTASGKAIFQYDPVQGRCISVWDGEPVQFAQLRLWLEDRPTQMTDYFWPVWPDQVVPDPNQQQESKRRGLPPNGTEEERGHNYLAKRQETWVPGVRPSLYPSCLAAIENTGSGPAEATAVLVGPDGPVSGYGGGSGITTSATDTTIRAGSGQTTLVSATTAGNRVLNSASVASAASAASAASVAAASYAMITSNPLCSPFQNSEGGDGGPDDCNVLNLCECISGTLTGFYNTMSGPNACGYTALPSSTWDGQVICTQGASASAPSVTPPPPVTSGQIIYSESMPAASGSGTIVYGCTAITVEYDIDPYPFTTCVGSITPLTTLFPPSSTTTTSSSSSPRVSKLCNNDEWYTTDDDCLFGCFGGSCKELDRTAVKERCVDCAPPEPVWEWLCTCA